MEAADKCFQFHRLPSANPAYAAFDRAEQCQFLARNSCSCAAKLARISAAIN